MAAGWQHYQRGAIREADHAFRMVLRIDPQHADALYMLGVIGVQVGQNAEALEHLRRAVALRPDAGFFHYHLGLAHRGLGQMEEAVACYRRAIELQPDLVEAHNNLGVALQRMGRSDEAIASHQQAVRVKPDFAEAHNNLGGAYQTVGKLTEAIACYHEALRLRPAYSQAQTNLEALLRYRQATTGWQATPQTAHEWFTVGGMFQQQGLNGEAIVCYEQALEASPDFPDASSNLGVLLHWVGRIDDAIAVFRTGLARHPDHAALHNNLGAAVQAQGNWQEAIDCYREAVRCNPDYAMAYRNLGMALPRVGELDEAVTYLKEAIRSNPDYTEAEALLASLYRDRGDRAEAVAALDDILRRHPECSEAHFVRGSLYLINGDYERGWPEYEWRIRCKEYLAPPLGSSQPVWDGTPLNGRTILLRAEQGYGDALQFIRYAPLVKERGGQVVVECQPPLAALLKSCPGVDQVITRGEQRPPFDTHALLMSLPYLLRDTVTAIPTNVPYLTPDSAHVERWRQELSAYPEFKVGIVWQGNPMNAADRFRSAPLRHFAPLARVNGVRLFSLQVGTGHEQLAEIADHFTVIDLGGRFDPASFDDAAAAVKSLDLIVTVCSGMAHLAGALGAPMWVALTYAADWRWLLDRDDSPWYPTAHLFRQKRRGDWDDVFERIAGQIATHMHDREISARFA
jgi:tetratricopeptide (TPR) repeat protein/ADP-heptose:LPS heptosyltransferase